MPNRSEKLSTTTRTPVDPAVTKTSPAIADTRNAGNAPNEFLLWQSSIGNDNAIAKDTALWLEESTPDVFSRLTNKWGFGPVLCCLAAKHWTDRALIASQMVEMKDFFQHEKRGNGKKLTVAFYYRKIAGGGAERVTAQLTSMLSVVKNNDGTENTASYSSRTRPY